MSKSLKIGIVLLALLCIALLAVTFFDVPAMIDNISVLAQIESTPVPQQSGDIDADLLAAVTDALGKSTDRFDADSYIVDNVQLQDDGQVAAIWLAAVDPETSAPIGREPELMMAQMEQGGNWKVVTDEEEKFADVLTEFQYADKSIQGDITADPEPLPKDTRVFGGYYLPWAQNLTKRLTWSVGHSSCYPAYYCTHAFDFADGTMFPLVAAKGGRVYHWKDTCTNGDSSCTNSITLEDRSTTPWTYQIYLHIAKGSIPSNLKQVGTPVMQGQYIADVDDTGYSTGHHVHFMVVSEETKYISTSGYVWGVALDITFKDVFINWDSATQGGRPRLAYEADSYGGVGQTYYTSGNAPAHPPTGALTAPAANTFITTPTFNVSGWGQDDIAVTKLEILANYDGENWVTLSEQTSTPFTASINLCDTDIPDGFFKLALRVWDYEGNPSSIVSQREMIKDVTCDAGAEPVVSLDKTGGKVLLPNSGQVSATVMEGGTGSAIQSVQFWFHKPNWSSGEWELLGTDTNGADGWKAPFEAGDLAESDDYKVMAIAADASGNNDADVNFMAVLDKTGPWIELGGVRSPFEGSQATLTWTTGDVLSGVDYLDLLMKVNDGDWQVLETNLSPSIESYVVSASDAQLIIFQIRAVDYAGNIRTQKSAFYTNGYEFENEYIFPLITN
ncbi:MAG: peptidoglycan DD-metalloendopeptidase family protein [Chloroflexota bacterium]|nr:peptidoglycan DD-metalloendopeptidase family protein [Chloroflexota bacterium]